MIQSPFLVQGAGLGLRRPHMEALAEAGTHIGFMEIAPENWMGLGGHHRKELRQLTEQFPFVCHGLSLSIGSPSPLDMDFLKKLKVFLRNHDIKLYSEHLSYCSDDGHLYDLMPIPFTEEAIQYVAERIRIVQDTLEQRISMENVSYYADPGSDMNETDFLNAVLEEADCDLLLDVNNIYVNSINHKYDAIEYLKAIPGKRISYIHVAGHFKEAEDLIIDTHGADVIDPVWNLLDKAYECFGVLPSLLERDFNLPPLADLLKEVNIISELQNKWSQRHEPQRA